MAWTLSTHMSYAVHVHGLWKLHGNPGNFGVRAGSRFAIHWRASCCKAAGVKMRDGRGSGVL